MPARNGRQYLTGLKEQDRQVWLGGERVSDVTTHPGLAGGARAIASLYDMQCDAKFRDAMTYVSPTTGDRVGLVVHHPAHPRGTGGARRDDAELGAHDLRHDGALARLHERARSPAWAAAADYFARGRPEFGDNIRRYYEYIRENDIVLTHSLINLQRSRNVSGMFNLQEGTALRVVRETSAGLVVRGARVLATLGPLADEIAVYSPRLGAAHRRPQPVRRRLRHSLRHAGAALPVPRQLRPRTIAFRPSARLALRGNGLHRVLRRCGGAVGAGVRLRRCRVC